jgi:probable HAF family extracellular repeat protein
VPLEPCFGCWTPALAINNYGQVVGYEYGTTADGHAFRTAPNKPINPATDDLGTLLVREDGWPTFSQAYAINDSGQVAGCAGEMGHGFAFRTAPNQLINPATDDLGSLGVGFPGVPDFSYAKAINSFGEVTGYSTSHFIGVDPLDGSLYFKVHAFVYSTNAMYDLNDLIPSDSGWELYDARGINDAGQIIATGSKPGSSGGVRLDPIYKAFVQQPINADGTSVFSAKRGVVPVKFAVAAYGTQPSCTLPATIGIVKAGNGALASVDESTYSNPSDTGSNFRIDPTACQYIYNLSASSLGVGMYRVDISINGILVGHAVFALK